MNPSVTMRTVRTRISEADEEALSELEDDLGLDRSEVLRRVLRKGLEEWRTNTALDQVREHDVTIRRAAELAEVPYVEMLSLVVEEDIDIGYTTEELEGDLARI